MELLFFCDFSLYRKNIRYLQNQIQAEDTHEPVRCRLCRTAQGPRFPSRYGLVLEPDQKKNKIIPKRFKKTSASTAQNLAYRGRRQISPSADRRLPASRGDGMHAHARQRNAGPDAAEIRGSIELDAGDGGAPASPEQRTHPEW